MPITPIDLEKYRLAATPTTSPSPTIDLSKYKLAGGPPEQKSVGGFLGNVFKSGASAIGGIVSAVTHPKRTLRSIGDVVQGTTTTLGQKALGITPKTTTPEQDKASAVGKFFKDRYGSFNKAKETAYNDPVGFLLDASTVLTGAGGVLGKVGEVSKIDELSRAGSVVSKVGETINPLTKATEVAGSVAGKVLPKVESPFASAYDPSLAQKFKEAGISKPPLSAISKSPVVRGGESIAAKSMFGEDIYKQIDNTVTALNDEQSRLLTKIKPESIGTQEDIGKTVQKGLNSFDQKFKATQSRVYEAFNEKASALPAETNKTQSILKTIVDEQGKDLYSRPDGRYQKMLDAVSKGKNLTFNEMKITRTAIGEDLAKTGDTKLARLYGALSEDMNSTVSSADKGLGKELTKITENYKNGVQKVQSNITQSILKSNPENIAKNLFNRNSATTLKTLKGMVGTEGFQEISDAFMANTLEKSYTRGSFDIAKFEKNLSDYDRPVLEQLLNEKQLKTLDETIEKLKTNQELRDAMKPGTKTREGSQTAYIIQRAGEASGGITAIALALSTGNIAPVIGAIMGYATEYGGVKLFATSPGRQFLTGGLNLSKPVADYLSRISPLVGHAGQGQRLIAPTSAGQ